MAALIVTEMGHWTQGATEGGAEGGQPEAVMIGTIIPALRGPTEIVTDAAQAELLLSQIRRSPRPRGLADLSVLPLGS